ncbi:MAG TPA: oligosaccharide flippase family protein [Chitinophagaceae bacterium]|nr:oligosaccharide flippase family protein [Chitinophagaceae bacterium]
MKTKKVLANSIIYVILGFLAPAVNFFLIPIYTRELSTADFGIITLANIIVSVLVNLMGLGLVGAFARFYYEELSDRGNQLKLFSTTLFGMLIAGLVIGLVFYITGQQLLSSLFTNRSFTIESYGIFVIFTALGMNIQTLVQALYRNDENVKLYTIWSIVFFLTVVIGVYSGVVILQKGALGSVGGRMWGTIIPVLVFLVAFFTKYPPAFNRKMAVSMLNYGWPLVIYLMLSLAFNSVDKVMVERYFKDLSVLGVYGFAFLIASVMEIFLNAINSAVNPQVYRLLKENTPDASKQVNQLLKMVVLTMLLLLLGLIVVAAPAITWFIKLDYQEAVLYLPLLFIAYIPRIYFTIYSIPLFYFNKTRVLPWISAVSFIAGLLLSILFIPVWGIYGICVAVLLTRAVQCVLAYYTTRYFKLPSAKAFSMKSTYVFSIIITAGTFLLTYIQLKAPASWRLWLFIPLALIYSCFFGIKYKKILTQQLRLLTLKYQK